MKKSLLLQISVPFCVRRCAHCPRAVCKYDPLTAHAYAEAVLEEIEAVAPDMTDYAVKAVAFEEGCPALLDAADLQAILRALRRRFDVDGDAQISLRTLPGDQSRALMERMRDAGVDLWTVGLATADRREHDLLRRPYRFDALTMVDVALRTFDPRRLSFDLLYGIPGQTPRSWAHTLETALAYRPDHLTTRPLDLTVNSALRADVALGLVEPLDRAVTEAIEAYTDEKLTGLGYACYLPHRYCLPGKEDRFKLYRSRGVEQLGLGYRAVTIMDGLRYTNGHSLREYMTCPGDIAVLVNDLMKLE